jgi:hypothetical protein
VDLNVTEACVIELRRSNKNFTVRKSGGKISGVSCQLYFAPVPGNIEKRVDFPAFFGIAWLLVETGTGFA